MKLRTFAISALAAAFVLSAGALVACNPHTHTFDTEHWTSDENNHWHAATCDHKDEKKDVAAHEWQTVYDADGKVWKEVCVTCEYQKANSSVDAGLDEAHPIPVYTAADYRAIASGAGAAKKYYKLMNDLTLGANDAETGKTNAWGTAYHSETVENIQFNGGGYKITSLTDAWLFDLLINSTVKNLVVETQGTLVADARNATFEKVDVYGDIFRQGGNNAVYFIYVRQGLTMKDCTNFATVNCTGDDKSYNAVFVGYPLSTLTKKQTLKFENCKNAGKFASGRAAMFVANGSQSTDNSTNLEIKNCGNIQNGEVRGTVVRAEGKINPFCAVAENKLGAITVDGTAKQVTDLDAMGAGFVNGPEDVMNLTENADGTFTFGKSEKTGVAYYVVSVGLYTKYQSGGLTGTNRFYVTERINATEAATYTSTLKDLKFVDFAWVTANPTAEEGNLAGNKTYTLGGETYYLIQSEGSHSDGAARPATIFSVSAYSADGKLISSVGL